MDERARSREIPGSRAVALIFGGLLGTAAAAAVGARGVEPVATWLYPFAWYPLLLAFEGALALRTGRFLLLRRPVLLVSVLAWSVPVWMVWELLNFRVANWYYVFVPDRRPALWTGIVVSFATVLPACFLPAALFRSVVGWGGDPSGRGRPPRGRIPAAGLAALRLTGVAMLVLPLLWPRIFFPLIWGAFVFLTEPDLHRAAPSRSLLSDVVDGRWDRVVALLCGGAVAGLAWEALNALARSRWIYTVPGLEELKLFEMPPLGFLGFPALALSCWGVYQWLALRGWAAPLDLRPGDDGPPAAELGPAGPDSNRPAPAAGRAWAAAAILVVVTLLGMESLTVSSTTPRLRDLPGLLPSDVEALEAWGVGSPFALARADADELSGRIPGVSEAEARSWIASARLATTRGIGARHARVLKGWGIGSLEELARTEPEALARCFSEAGPEGERPARVRVWWRAARDQTEDEGPADGIPSC